MAVKKTCDRCNKEAESLLFQGEAGQLGYGRFELERTLKPNLRADLCIECSVQVLKDISNHKRQSSGSPTCV